MSVSLGMYGVMPPTDEYRKKLAVYRACRAAKVEVPEEVQRFFDDHEPDELGIEVDVRDNRQCTTEFSDDCREGYVVDLEKLPRGVRYLRVYLSC